MFVCIYVQIKRSGKCVIVFKTRCLEALLNKSCWPQRKPLMNALFNCFFMYFCCASALLNVTFHTMRKREVKQKPLNPTRSALLCSGIFLIFCMTCQFTWLGVKIEGPPPNYFLLLQSCSHFPKVSYTWTSLFNLLEDVFWWNKSGCCETRSVTVIAGNRAACYKISQDSLYLTPMSL